MYISNDDDYGPLNVEAYIDSIDGDRGIWEDRPSSLQAEQFLTND